MKEFIRDMWFPLLLLFLFTCVAAVIIILLAMPDTRECSEMGGTIYKNLPARCSEYWSPN